MHNNNPLWLLPHVRITKYTQLALLTAPYIIGCKDHEICSQHYNTGTYIIVVM